MQVKTGGQSALALLCQVAFPFTNTPSPNQGSEHSLGVVAKPLKRGETRAFLCATDLHTETEGPFVSWKTADSLNKNSHAHQVVWKILLKGQFLFVCNQSFARQPAGSRRDFSASPSSQWCSQVEDVCHLGGWLFFLIVRFFLLYPNFKLSVANILERDIHYCFITWEGICFSCVENEIVDHITILKYFLQV